MMIYKALSVLLLMTGSLHMMAAQDGTTEYTILTQSPEQHIQHFGASDAWSMQFLGLWPEKQQEQIAGAGGNAGTGNTEGRPGDQHQIAD